MKDHLIEYDMAEICNWCNGTGFAGTCSRCNGAGILLTKQGCLTRRLFASPWGKGLVPAAPKNECQPKEKKL